MLKTAIFTLVLLAGARNATAEDTPLMRQMDRIVNRRGDFQVDGVERLNEVVRLALTSPEVMDHIHAVYLIKNRIRFYSELETRSYGYDDSPLYFQNYDYWNTRSH